MKLAHKYATKKECVEIYWKSLSGRQRIDLLNELLGVKQWSLPISFEIKEKIYDLNPLHQKSE